MTKSSSRWTFRVLIATALLLGGCATNYGPGRATGYTDERLDDRRYRVTFRANENTDKETVQRYLYYRLAELTQEKGFKYFMVEINAPQSDAGSAPRAGLDGAFIKTRGGGGGYSYYYVPGGTRTVRYWVANATINLFNDEDLRGPRIGWPAKATLDALQPGMTFSPKPVAIPRPSIIHPQLGVLPLPEQPPKPAAQSS
jgi:hypothetical protein